MASLDFESLRIDYELKFEVCQVTDTKVVNKAVKKMLENSAFYEQVEYSLGVPWYLVGAIHSTTVDSKITHQIITGEPWRKKTSLGLGPWSGWIESTVMALRPFKNQNWVMSKCLWAADRFSGFKGRSENPQTNSHFLWAGSSLYKTGGYTKENKFDKNIVVKKPGVGTILKYVSENSININKE